MSAPAGTDTAPPTLYTVPPERSFVDALAGGILAGRPLPLDRDDPLALSRLTILLPTRRACRALGRAFLRASPGQALLLPHIRPLGDVDEDEASIGDEADEALPDAIAPLDRRLLLARLIQRLGETASGTALAGAGAVDQASRLAQALAALLDEIQIARLDPAALATLAPEEYAAHWQQVLSFLEIIMDAWPAHLAEEGLMDPWTRRNALLERLAERWAAQPPPHPVIAAGSTGSVPATRDLLATIARLPQGAVVLPGLDTEADDETWEALGPTHPQYALKGLLDHLGVARDAVPPWPGDEGAGGNGGRGTPARAADRRRHAAGGDHRRLARPAAARRGSAARRAPHRLRQPAGGGGRHRDRHAPHAGDPRPHRRPGDRRPRACPPGRGGAPALAHRGGRFRRYAARRDAPRRLSSGSRRAWSQKTPRQCRCWPRSSIRSPLAAAHRRPSAAPSGPWSGRSCAARGRHRGSAG